MNKIRKKGPNIICLIIALFGAYFKANGQLAGDTLMICERDAWILSTSTKEIAEKYFEVNPKGIILLASNKIDSILLQRINEYRVMNGLPVLINSVRLDTLGKKVLFFLHRNHILTHYTSIKEMTAFRDLMNAENISHVPSLSQDQKFEPEEIMQGWVNSPKHNANLLLRDVEVGSAACLAKLTMENRTISIEVFCAFECDNAQSKRELTMKVDEINKKLLKRQIKFQRKR